MSELSEQQRGVIELDGDVFVTACPGSGKTRVLTEKIVSTLGFGISRTQRVAAVTYTRHAADEIGSRLLEMGYSRKQLWTGTIHSFALDWVLRPYAVYDPALSGGFAVADEHYLKKLVDSLRKQFGVNPRKEVNAGFDRHGQLVAQDENVRLLVVECRRQLKEKRLLDFDLVVYTAYSLLQRVPEIAKTLGALFKLICIDEYQDTHDLQYGILAAVVRASSGGIRLFIVGDKNQAIYSSLGGVAKTVQEVKDEFDRPRLFHRELSGNYRSTQRIVDFCGNLCESGQESIISLSSRAADTGLLTFSNQTIESHQLAARIAQLVKFHLANGVKTHEICILGPNWGFLKDIAAQLILTLPDVDIDAPGVSLLRYQPESFWFQLARLFLTDPSPMRYRARLKWAADFVGILEVCLGKELPEGVRSARSILRLVNAINSEQESGLSYLDEVFEKFFAAIEIDLAEYPLMVEERTSFFECAEDRLIVGASEFESVENLRKMFRRPSGVAVNTCHGVKGEEFEVVICFGLLRGYIPHWSRIIADSVLARLESRRLLYVIASRAKKFLHLHSESGRMTLNHHPYETTEELLEFSWDYDELFE